MRTLVVGGAGFIGSHLCDALLRDGHSVACMDNLSLGTAQNISHLLLQKNFTFYQSDAAVLEDLETIFSKEKIDYVFHLAANSDIQASSEKPEVEYRNTYTTTFNILYFMKKYKIKNLFFASTSAVYGDKRDTDLSENTPGLSPISYYGAAKLGSEALISAYTYMNDMSSLIFRFPNVIGPRLTHGVIFDFIDKLNENNTELKILGDGRQTKPYIYVSDLVDVIMQFMNIGKQGTEIYNIGVEGETCVTKIADFLCEEMRLNDVVYQYTGGEGGWKGDVPRFSYCLDKIHSAGWEAKYSSDEAVRKTIQEVLKERI